MKRLAIVLAMVLALQSVLPVSAMEAGVYTQAEVTSVSEQNGEETITEEPETEEPETEESEPETEEPETEEPETEEPETEEPETEEPETEEPETEEPETEEPETEEPETEEPETEEPETEESEAEESESEELISEKDILENDAESTLYGQEDYSEIISIYEKEAETLTTYVQDAYYFSQGSVSLILGAQIAEASISNSSTTVSDVYYAVGDQIYSVGTLNSNKAYYYSYYKTMTMVIDSFQVEADPDQIRDFKVYFTFDGTKYIMTGSAKFIDETKNSTRVYHFEEPEYFNPNKGSKIQLCSSSLTGYSSKDKIKKVELVSYETNKVVATGEISYNYISTSPETDRRYKSYFTGPDGNNVYLYSGIFPRDTYNVYVCSDFTLSGNLAEGYYDLLYTAENGVKFREMNRYKGTQESHVYSVSNDPNARMYEEGIFFQDQGDYVSVYVYGININEKNVPVFYVADSVYGRVTCSTYDENDSRCGYEQRDEWGSCFVVKKTQSWNHGEDYTVRIDNATMHAVDSMHYWDTAIYLLEKTDSYIRAYISANTGIQEGTELTWVHSPNRWSTSLAEEAVTVKKNEFGLYVEVGSKSTIFAKGDDYYVDLRKSGETVASGQFYSGTIPTIKPVSKITVPSGCTFEIHPINQVAQVLYSGKSTSGTTGVLTNAQMVELSKKGSFRVCIYNGDGTLKDRYLACSTVKEAEKYPIAYELNGGVNDKENPEFYSKGDAFTLKAPSKAYANFAGWYSDANLTKAMPGIKATDSGAKTFYAKWQPYTYTIKFDANGGTGTMKDFGCSYGTSSVLPTNSFTKKGYNFVGWSTVQNPDEEAGTGYENQAQVLNLVDIDKGSITLYAQWEIADYRIIYHTAGGVNNSKNVKSYTVEDEVTFHEPTSTMNGISFAGWFRENTYRTSVSGIEKGNTGDIHVYARWVPNTYTVEFDVNAPADAAVSGTMANVKASYHADVTLPKNKLKCKGYTFAGWSKERAEVNGEVGYADMASINNLVEPQNNNDGKVTLYAVWKNQYDIVYHVDGGSLDEAAEGYFTTYQYGDVKALPIPVKLGYTFGGWYKDAGLKSKLASITGTTQGDFDLYAKWTANNYKIIFTKGENGVTGVSGKMSAQSMKYGVEKALAKNKFVRNGYKFVGWKASDGASYGDGETVTDFVPAKNNDTLNLEAQWEAVDYQITYMLDGGTFAEDDNVPHQYTFGTVVSLPGATAISREGYTFGGWYTDSNYKKKITGITAKTVGDLTLYAKWTANYTVVFHADDGEAVGTMAPLSMKYDTAKALTKNKFTLKKENSFGEVVAYGFTGWSLEPKGEVIYQNGEKIVRPEGLTTDENGKLVLNLYAVWDLFYTVTFIYPGGLLYGEADSVVSVYDYGTGIPKSNFATILPKKDGYTFAGWYSDSACKKRVTAISNKQTGDMVLYAKWTGVKYTVVFDANSDGVKGRMSNQKLTYGTEKALSKCAYKRTGYTFKGWSTEQNGEVVFTNQAKISTPVRDANNVVKLYAVWEKDTYSITYRNMRVGETDGYPESYQVDSDEIVLEEPERIGYTFLGWYADAKYKKKIEKIQTGSTGNLTLYAKWKVN